MNRSLESLSVHVGMASSYCHYAFPDAVNSKENFPENMQQMIEGMRAYQRHPYKKESQPLNVVWESGGVRLLREPFLKFKDNAPVVFLVPSLVNRSDILDLKPDRSLLRWLGQNGVITYLLDWGELSKSPQGQTIDDVIEGCLLQALCFVQHQEKQPVHAIGYCIGGTLLAGAAAWEQSLFRSLVFLASPWDFHAGSQALLKRVKFWAPSAFPSIEAQGKLPADWLQALFASLDPALTMKKFSNFAKMDPHSKEAELFVAVEDWLNDGVILPGEVAQHCITNWFLKNEPASGNWFVKGKKIEPEKFKIPALIIASTQDRLVEYEMASALQKSIAHSEIYDPECGHIGMIAGRKSVEGIWPEILQFVLKYEACKVSAS